MAEQDLNNAPTQQTLLASLNALYAALNGTLGPRDAAGLSVAAGADLGSTTKPWDAAYITQLIAGGQLVDVASLALAAPFYIITADDDSFLWPSSTKTKCLAWAISGCGGGRSSGGVNGQNGGATTITFGGVTVSSGIGPGSEGGGSQTNRDAVSLGAFAHGGNQPVRSNSSGLTSGNYRLLTGLDETSTLDIAIGAGGAGGTQSGVDGQDGPDGLAILIALP